MQSPRNTISSDTRWERAGLVLGSGESGWGQLVIGDPCVVWDAEAGAWRMFLFALPPGHAQALCSGDPCDPGSWIFEGPLALSNPEALIGGGGFKPFVVIDAGACHRPARIDGRFALLFVANHTAKLVQRAWATSLSGPWTVEERALIACGTGDDFDARHVDAVSAYYFRERDEIVYFYMGYPQRAQPHALSPFGSAQGVAAETVGSGRVRKHGPILRPSALPGHWASGWVGGLQLLAGKEHRWIAILNASPSAPDRRDLSLWTEEPPPSLGGMAVCDEEHPVHGWRWSEKPFEWIGDIPADARAAGERVNLWRHFALVLGDRAALFYNSGDYFEERLYMKRAWL